MLRWIHFRYIERKPDNAILVWSPDLRSLIQLLEWVQRNATRMVSYFSGLSYKERREALDLLTFKKEG